MTTRPEDELLQSLDLDSIQDPHLRRVIAILLNLIELKNARIAELEAENQRLRDEVNRLKGEQGKPDIKPGPPKGFGTPHSSEAERRVRTPKRKSSKNECILIDREVCLSVPQDHLPADALFKGYQPVIVQDLQLGTDNIRFLKEKFYSPTTQKTYLAALPPGYHGQFGPKLKALVLHLYYGCNTTAGKILSLLRELGVVISSGQVAQLLIAEHTPFHQEKQAVLTAGLGSTSFQHYDHTPARVAQQNWQTHVLGNPYYSYYCTQPSKSRLSVLSVLWAGEPLCLRFDASVRQWLEVFSVPPTKIAAIASVAQGEYGTLSDLEAVLPRLGAQHKARVLEAMVLGAYGRHRLQVQTLVCDDAPQFKWVSKRLALCWVHEGRHYKKLRPSVPQHQRLLGAFVEEFWEYYHNLKSYRERPQPELGEICRKEFRRLFSRKTGYDLLDERIARTLAHEEQLLAVLENPALPLHNNDAELAARTVVRRRDISGGTRTEGGTKAWDTFLSLLSTTRKLGVSFYSYLRDRIGEVGEIRPLAELIEHKARADAPTPIY
jgi:hypothetical protein